MQQEVFEQAVEQYLDMVLQIAYQRLKNQTDAQDISQEVFLRLLTADPQFENTEHQKAWLIRVTINLCKNQLKTVWNKRTDPLTENDFSLNREQQEILQSVWALPPKYRDVLYLYYYQGYSVAEISSILKKKPNTIGSWLHRARAKLKIQLTGGLENE